MGEKKAKLDAATAAVVKRVLATPPKHNEELKVGRASGPRKEGEGAKILASSAKRRSASRTERG